jgi:hypothetical protein
LKGPNFWPIANLNSNRRDCYLYFAGDGNRRPISRQDDLRAARDPTSENNACPQGRDTVGCLWRMSSWAPEKFQSTGNLTTDAHERCLFQIRFQGATLFIHNLFAAHELCEVIW